MVFCIAGGYISDICVLMRVFLMFLLLMLRFWCLRFWYLYHSFLEFLALCAFGVSGVSVCDVFVRISTF